MDYTNFVKTYYRTALKHLNRFHTYDGFFNELNYDLDIDPKFIHNTETNLNVLPNFDLNIDAPLSEYEKFVEYYSKLYPQLGLVFASGEDVNKYYDLAIQSNLLGNDEKAIDFIDLLVNINIDILQQSGVLK